MKGKYGLVALMCVMVLALGTLLCCTTKRRNKKDKTKCIEVCEEKEDVDILDK